MDGEHVPVLLSETLCHLAPQPGEVVLDGTVGGGGHARAMLDAAGATGRLVGLDRDGEVLARARERLEGAAGRWELEQANFADFEAVLDRTGIATVDVALVDLGVSSFQIDSAERGFSFQQDGPLDMRMDRSSGMSAADVVNECDERELADIFFQYGEERHSRRIARRIVSERERERIETTGRLASIVLSAQGGGRRGGGWQRIHPATRVFQALRIYVNGELEALERFCEEIWRRVSPGGRVGVISFHSLEDRIVKQTYRRLAGEAVVEIVTRKPVVASEEERSRNPRSRSAKLRVARRTGEPQG